MQNETTKKGNPMLSLNYFRSQKQLFWKPTEVTIQYALVTMQRVRITRISSYAQKVGVVLARRAIMIVNMT